MLGKLLPWLDEHFERVEFGPDGKISSTIKGRAGVPQDILSPDEMRLNISPKADCKK